MTYTIMDIPYWSIIPNLTSNPEEREKVSVLPRIFASIGQSLVIAGFGVQIIEALSGGTTNAGKRHARRNEVFLERNFVTLGNTIRPTTSAIDALIINDDIIPALPQTYLK